MLYKLARTSKSKHYGLYHNLSEAKNDKNIVGNRYHIYKLEGKIGSIDTKWVMVLN